MLFPGLGMDQDTSEYSPLEEFSKGAYRYALNLRVNNTAKNQTNAGEILPSSLLISSYLTWNGTAWVSGSAQAGVNTALSKYEDRSAGIVYWCVFNSFGHHSILYYDKYGQKIYELLQWDGLNFEPSNYPSMTKINKYLLITDGNPSDYNDQGIGNPGNPPRCMDVTTISQLKVTLGANFSEFHISLSKWPPLMPPFLTMSGATIVGQDNFLNKRVFQFAYRYIFVGGFRSTWSPQSNFVSNDQLALLQGAHGGNQYSPNPLSANVQIQVNAPGFVFDYNNASSYPGFFSNTDIKFYNLITYIEFGYRESEYKGWQLFARVPITNASQPTSTIFTNQGSIGNVAANDIGQYFDSVPLLSRCVEAIDNRPVLGNNFDDLPPLSNFDVTDIAVYSTQPTNDNWFTGAGVGDPLYSLQQSSFPIQRFSFKEGGIYKLGIIFQHYSGRMGLVQTLDKWMYQIPVTSSVANQTAIESFHGLGFKIGSNVTPPDWAVAYQIVRTNCLNIDFFITGVVNDFKFLQIDLGAGSDSTVTTADNIRTAISGYYDNFESGSGATYSLISRILTGIRKNQVVALATDATLIYIDIRNWYLDTITNPGGPPKPSNNAIYNWQPGDRVKFWMSQAADFSGPYDQFDQEIIEFTGTALIVAKPDTSDYIGTRVQVSTATVNPSLFTVEVYRPKKFDAKDQFLYYEMGEWYPIIPQGRFRNFSKTDWTWNGRAGVAITYHPLGYSIYSNLPVLNGDVWLVTKNFMFDYQASLNGVRQGYLGPFISGVGNPFADINDYPIFPQMTQDKYNSAGTWEHNNGRALVAYEYLPVQFEKTTQVRFGGKFLEDSIFIGINNFQDDNQKIYPSEYGAIRAMVNTSNTQVKDVGQILMVICEEETMDVYVNRATLQQLGGDTQVTLSDQVLGSYNTLLGSYGTLNPESVSKRNSRVLFWNAKRGMWIRRSIDGLTPISNYKMQNWFKDLANILMPTYAAGNAPTVVSAFDAYYEEWVTYITQSSLPGTFRGYSSYKCASFDEDSKRWNTVYDYAPDVFAALENELYSIIGTVVHIHYAGADYGSIYGVKKDCMWQPVANPEFRVTKVWKALNEQSTDKWSLPSINGDFRSNSISAQNSALLLTDLTSLENTFWADIKRDLNTINAANSDQAIVNGDPMRSRALTLMLKLDPSVTWYSFINWLVVTFDRSEKTVKK